MANTNSLLLQSTTTHYYYSSPPRQVKMSHSSQERGILLKQRNVYQHHCSHQRSFFIHCSVVGEIQTIQIATAAPTLFRKLMTTPRVTNCGMFIAIPIEIPDMKRTPKEPGTLSRSVACAHWAEPVQARVRIHYVRRLVINRHRNLGNAEVLIAQDLRLSNLLRQHCICHRSGYHPKSQWYSSRINA